MPGGSLLVLGLLTVALLGAVLLLVLWRKASDAASSFERTVQDLLRLKSDLEGRLHETSEKLGSEQRSLASLREKATNQLGHAKKVVAHWRARYERLAHWDGAQDAIERTRELEAKQARAQQILDALRNAVDGYGARYVVPPQSLLDDLAREAAHTEPGQRLKEARAASRAMVRDGAAATSDYAQDGRGELAANFALDAFNGKVESILADVKSDNIGTLVQRLKDAFLLVNTQGRAFGNSRITQEYLDARLAELRWGALVQRIKKDHREEQRRIKERMREEAKSQREFERAERESKKQEADAARERALIEAAREQAILDERVRQEARLREELKRLSESQRESFERDFRSRMEQELSATTAQYEGQLAEADERIRELEALRERAKSMAQQTKKGTVYVISNVGSFGEGVFKIGQTRRLDPMERIWELGDASVPFEFDVHVLIAADDAPKLESTLHECFVLAQVNKMNWRKEFFRVPLTQIRLVVDSMGLDAEWTMEAAAQEFRETQALELQLNADADYRDRWVAEQLGRDVGDVDLEKVAEDISDTSE
ncbi:MAG: DUF4041 domain-containing protein [Planctomycetes bacterium]|nr:DUF4041 domain-containing protein [Planctomycetota bacterium]